MDSITELWDQDLDVAEYTSADFQGRHASLSVYDSTGVYRNTLDELSELFGLDAMEVADFAVRVYVAAAADGRDISLHENFEQVRLVPPRGWVQAHRDGLPRYKGEVEGRSLGPNERGQFNPSSTEMVRDMIRWINEQHDVHSGLNETTKAAITFVVDGYNLGGDLLETRL